MEKKIKTIIIFVIAFLLFLGSLGMILSNKKTTYTVTYLSDGVKKTIKVEEGIILESIAPEEREGYRFIGWYLNEELYDFSKPIESNLKLEARWEIISDEVKKICTVNFNNDGTIVESRTIMCGEKLNEKEIYYGLTKSGYIFVEWQLNNKTFIFNNKITEDITLTAKWQEIKKQKYTVTFESNGGSTISSILVEEGEKVVFPNIPTKSGYAFIEWQLNGKMYDFNSPVTRNITLKVKWEKIEKNQYAIVFDSSGGSLVSTQIIEEGNMINKPINPTRSGYTFVEWQLNGKTYNFNSAVTNSLTLKAIWKANTYKITYYQGQTLFSKTSQHTSGVSSKLLTYNELKATAPTGWEFAGWTTDVKGTKILFNDGTTINFTTDNTVNLYAIFKRTIRFNSGINNATKTTVIQYYNPRNTSYITSVTVPNPSLTGLSNYGWNILGYRTDKAANDATYKLSALANITISANVVTSSSIVDVYAVYKRTITAYSGTKKSTTKTYTQYLNSNENTVSSINIERPASITNWEALGYRVNTSPSSATYNAKETTSIQPAYNTSYTLYGVYRRALAIYYQSNGGTGTMSRTSRWVYLNSCSESTSSQELTISTNVFQKTGYSFNKWAQNSVDGTRYNEGEKYDPNLPYNASSYYINMCALWTANTYTIKFNLLSGENGTAPKTINVVYGKPMPKITFSPPTKSENTFDGWGDENGVKYYNADGTSVKNWDQAKDGNLYALWNPLKYNVTVNVENGYIRSGNAQNTVNSGSSLSLYIDPNDNYEFSKAGITMSCTNNQNITIGYLSGHRIDIKNVSSNTVCTVHFNESYKVTYHIKDASGISKTTDKCFIKNGSCNITTATITPKSGQLSVGWILNENSNLIIPVNSSYVIKGNIDLYAFTINQNSFNIYISKTGNDSNSGLTSGRSISTIQKAFNILANVATCVKNNTSNTNKDIVTATINISSGTYKNQMFYLSKTISNQLSNVNKIEIAGVKNNTIFETDSTDVENYQPSYFLSLQNNGVTTFKIHDFIIKHYNNGIIGRNLNNSEILNVSFIEIGNIYNLEISKQNHLVGYAAIDIISSSNNKIHNCVFDSVINSCDVIMQTNGEDNGEKACGHEHAVYLATNSSNNEIYDNTIKNIKPDPIRVRHNSNNNLVYNNSFTKTGTYAYYSEWYKTGEEISSGNKFYNNTLNRGYNNNKIDEIAVFKINTTTKISDIPTDRMEAYGNINN